MLHLNARQKLLRPRPIRQKPSKPNPKLKLVQEAPPKLLPYWPYDQDTTIYFPW